MCSSLSHYKPYKRFTLKQANYLPDHPGVCFSMCLDWLRRKLKKVNPKATFKADNHGDDWLKEKYQKWKVMQDHLVKKGEGRLDGHAAGAVRTLQWALGQPGVLAKFTPQEQVKMRDLLTPNQVRRWEAKGFKGIGGSDGDEVSALWQRAEGIPECKRRYRDETAAITISKTTEMMEDAAGKSEKFNEIDLAQVKATAFVYGDGHGVWNQIAEELDPELGDEGGGHLLMITLYGAEKKEDGTVKAARHAVALHYWKAEQRFHFIDPNFHEYEFSDRVTFAGYLDALWKEKKKGYGNFDWEQWAVFRCFPV